MKKSFTGLALFATMVLALTSCRETQKEDPDKVVVEKEVVREVEVKEEDKGLLEEAASEVDKEVNEEVSEEIDKIGDDQ